MLWNSMTTKFWCGAWLAAFLLKDPGPPEPCPNLGPFFVTPIAFRIKMTTTLRRDARFSKMATTLMRESHFGPLCPKIGTTLQRDARFSKTRFGRMWSCRQATIQPILPRNRPDGFVTARIPHPYLPMTWEHNSRA